MSDHDDFCGIEAMLPVALGTLDHVHECHSEHEITSYTGLGNVKTDVYIVSGSARAKFQELRDTLNRKNATDISELDSHVQLEAIAQGFGQRYRAQSPVHNP